jgi:hypothetical protein
LLVPYLYALSNLTICKDDLIKICYFVLMQRRVPKFGGQQDLDDTQHRDKSPPSEFWREKTRVFNSVTNPPHQISTLALCH